jgi:hypothetical protein
MRFLRLPPMPVNHPPAYTVVPETASVSTELFAFGFQAVAFPVATSRAATRLRRLPPMLLNPPPT